LNDVADGVFYLSYCQVGSGIRRKAQCKMDALKAGFAVYVCTGTNSICFGIFTFNLRRQRI
jgi:hypothetical protein